MPSPSVEERLAALELIVQRLLDDIDQRSRGRPAVRTAADEQAYIMARDALAASIRARAIAMPDAVHAAPDDELGGYTPVKAAAEFLRKLGFLRVENEVPAGTFPPGVVISQSPVAGASTTYGATVTLTVTEEAAGSQMAAKAPLAHPPVLPARP